MMKFTITDIKMLPVTNQNFIVWGRDNGAYSSLVFSLTTAGLGTVGVGINQAAFTTGAEAALWGSSVCYHSS